MKAKASAALPAGPLPRLHSPGYYARETGIPRPSIYRLVADGRIRHLRYQLEEGGRAVIKIEEADFWEWYRRNRVEPTR